MKKIVIKIINRIESFRETRPRLFKLCMTLLWIVCFEEMICIKLGIWGYHKINQYSKETRRKEA